jgi:hypothetical protein
MSGQSQTNYDKCHENTLFSRNLILNDKPVPVPISMFQSFHQLFHIALLDNYLLSLWLIGGCVTVM